MRIQNSQMCSGSSKSLHDLTADKLEHDPSLLRIPLSNIDRWIAKRHTAPHRLEQWQQIILRAQQSDEGFRELVALLRHAQCRVF